jgi:DNA gyrase subunit A
LGKRTPFLEKLEGESGAEEQSNIVEISNATGELEKYQLAYRVTNRGGKGVKTINITEKTGALVGLLAVDEKDDLMITCKSGITIRMRVADIREAGRATQGVKLINIDEGDEIAAIARIAEQEVQGDEDDEAAHIVDMNPVPEA